MYANKLVCSRCPLRHKCIKGNRRYKEVEFTKDSLQIIVKWHDNYTKNKDYFKTTRNRNYKLVKIVKLKFRPNKEKMDKRKNLSEHPFGTIKRAMGFSCFLLKGLRKVAGEFALMCLGYNMKRARNLLGFEKMMELMAAGSC